MRAPETTEKKRSKTIVLSEWSIAPASTVVFANRHHNEGKNGDWMWHILRAHHKEGGFLRQASFPCHDLLFVATFFPALLLWNAPFRFTIPEFQAPFSSFSGPIQPGNRLNGNRWPHLSRKRSVETRGAYQKLPTAPKLWDGAHHALSCYCGQKAKQGGPG